MSASERAHALTCCSTKFIGVVLLAALLSLTLACGAQAQQLTVTSSADNGPGSLRETVQTARFGDVVTIASGVDPVLSSEPIIIEAGITIQGQGAKATTVTGDGLPQDPVFVNCSCHSALTRISDMKITGGGLGAVANEANLVLRRVLISGNSNSGAAFEAGPGLEGGGVNNEFNFATPTPAELRIEDSTIAHNTGYAYGGAIVNMGNLRLINDTIANNTVIEGIGGEPSAPIGGYGGAIATLFIGHTSLTNTTVAYNDAQGEQASELYSEGPEATYTLGASIIAGGEPTQNCSANIELFSVGHNIDSDGSCVHGENEQASDLSAVPALLASMEPLDNGGPTPTLALTRASPAVDSLRSSDCLHPLTDEPLSHDQRGVERPQAAACDSGAYELAPPVGAGERTSSIALDGATLSAQVNPNAQDTIVFFRYGTSTSYTGQTTAQSLAGFAPTTQVSAQIAGLGPGRTIHYELIATNADGAYEGPDQTFTTVQSPPGPEMGSVNASSGSSADACLNSREPRVDLLIPRGVLNLGKHSRTLAVTVLNHNGCMIFGRSYLRLNARRVAAHSLVNGTAVLAAANAQQRVYLSLNEHLLRLLRQRRHLAVEIALGIQDAAGNSAKVRGFYQLRGPGHARVRAHRPHVIGPRPRKRV